MSKTVKHHFILLFAALLFKYAYSVNNIAYVASYTGNSVSIYFESENNNLYKWKDFYVRTPFATAISPNKHQLYILQTSMPLSVKELSTSWKLDPAGLVNIPPTVQTFTTEAFSHQMVFIPNLNRRIKYLNYAYIVSKSAVTIHGLDNDDNISQQALGFVPGITSPTSMATMTTDILGYREIYAYITDLDHNQIKMYSIVNGGINLTPLDTPSIQTGTNPIKVIVSHNSKYVYTVCYSEKAIYVYRINGFDGTLTYVTKTNTFGLNPTDIAIDFYNEKAFVTANNIVLVYSIMSDGSLVYDETASKQVGPMGRSNITAMALDDSSPYTSRGNLYIAADQINQIHKFQLNRSIDTPFNLTNRQIIDTDYSPISITLWRQ